VFLSSSSVPTIKHELIVLDVLLVVLRLAGYLINFIGEYLYYAIFKFTSKRIAKATEEERKALSISTESMKLSP